MQNTANIINDEQKEPYLIPGDTINLIAPATGFSKEEYNSCLTFIKNIGLQAIVPPYDKMVQTNDNFCCNTTSERSKMLHAAINSKTKAIWCINGGHGSYQLIEELENLPLPKPKLLIGYSDITILMNYVIKNWNWPCIHGPMLKQIIKQQVSDTTIKQTKQLIFETPQTTSIADLTPLNTIASKPQTIQGQLIGGCLSLIQTLIGTPQNIDLNNKILLLEDDKHETPARIDRILNHMHRAQFFKGVKAIILGSFLEEDNENKTLNTAFNNLNENLKTQNIPLIRSPKLGHNYNMTPIPLGTQATIELNSKPVMYIKNNLTN